MELEIHRVQNASTPAGEVVILRALADTNLHYFAVVDATFNADGSMSNEHRHVYFFPRKALKKDEWVVLCSGKGTNGTGKFRDGESYHLFFWQSGTCIWNNNGADKASLIKYYNGNTVNAPAV